jgi:hypothetical protein
MLQLKTGKSEVDTSDDDGLQRGLIEPEVIHLHFTCLSLNSNYAVEYKWVLLTVSESDDSEWVGE